MVNKTPVTFSPSTLIASTGLIVPIHVPLAAQSVVATGHNDKHPVVNVTNRTIKNLISVPPCLRGELEFENLKPIIPRIDRHHAAMFVDHHPPRIRQLSRIAAG